MTQYLMSFFFLLSETKIKANVKFVTEVKEKPVKQLRLSCSILVFFSDAAMKEIRVMLMKNIYMLTL